MLQLPPFKQATPIAILNIEFPSFNGTWRSLVARLLGVQEAVSSNLAVPTFTFNHLRASSDARFYSAQAQLQSAALLRHSSKAKNDGQSEQASPIKVNDFKKQQLGGQRKA